MADLNNLLGGLDVRRGGERDDDEDSTGKENISYDNAGRKNVLEKYNKNGFTSLNTQEEVVLDDSISPYERLKIAWMQELGCPELLPYDDEVMSYFFDFLAMQEEEIENYQQQNLRGAGRDSSSRTGINNIRQSSATHAAAQEANQMISALSVNLMKMEMSRVRFVMTDLLRTRLWKIEKYALFNRKVIDRMSEDEIQYLKQYGKLMEQHFKRSVLSNLPNSFSRLDDPNMIETPDLDATVFCKLLADITLPPIVSSEDDDENDVDPLFADDNDPNRRTKGSIIVTRYSRVRKHVLEGKVLILA